MKPTKQHIRGAFTLIEILVSMVVLSMMLFAVAGVIGLVSRTWGAQIAAMDNFSKARVILTLMDRDIQSMVLRPDLAAFVDNTGAPACAFYTRVPGNQDTSTPDSRTVSLIQYLLTSSVSPPVLERLEYGINFPPAPGQTTPAGLTLSIGNLTQLPNLANINATQTEILSSGVLLLQIQFLNGSGAISTPPAMPFSFNFTNPGSPSNPRIVIVSMLVLSDSAYDLAYRTNNLSTLLALFPSAGLPANETYSQYWNGILNTPGFGSNLATPIRGGIRVYSRQVPLPLTTSPS